MDPKLLLVKLITLLYKESHSEDKSVNSNDLAKAALATIKPPEGSGEFDRSRDVILALRSTAMMMADSTPNGPYDQDTIFQTIRINCGDDVQLYQAFEAGAKEVSDQIAIKRQCILMRGEIRNAVNAMAIKEIVKKFYRQTHFDMDGFDVKKLAVEITNSVGHFAVGGMDEKIAGLLNELSLDDVDRAEEFLVQAMTETSAEGIMRLGHQAINRMTGVHQGFRRGEAIVLGALQHNYKTGMVLTWFMQLLMYNQPYMRDPTKKPLALFVSTENDTHMNIIWMYRHLKEQETGEPVPLSAVQPREAAEYVRDKLQANGYTVKMYRMDPSTTTYASYTELILKLEAEGYEVHVAGVDYLNMFNKEGMIQGSNGFESRDLWRRMRNFHGPRGTIFMSPHQLSPDAKRMIRTDMALEDFVKNIANKGYYDGCTTIDQEVDLEFYIHIVKVNGKKYLTIQRGKHRGVNDTPDAHLYTVLPFMPVGNIPDDINGPDISMKKPGNDQLGGDGDSAWHSF